MREQAYPVPIFPNFRTQHREASLQTGVPVSDRTEAGNAQSSVQPSLLSLSSHRIASHLKYDGVRFTVLTEFESDGGCSHGHPKLGIGVRNEW